MTTACFTLLFTFFLMSSALEAQGDVVKSQFPEGFLFGTSSSAYQFEGAVSEDGKGRSNWDHFTHVHAAKISGGSNGDVADDHYHLYMEDIDLMHDLGATSYRFSISWARVLPRGRFGGVNQAGIDFYSKLIDNLLSRGIEPFVTIHHHDLPQELEDRYGSWLSAEMQKDFILFAEVCFRSFGGRVKYWNTINEINLVTRFAYQKGLYPPAHFSEREPFLAAHNMLLAHAKAVDLYRKSYQAKQRGQIGVCICATSYRPLTDTRADRLATKRAFSFELGWVLDPLVFGNYPADMRRILGRRLPEFSPAESELIRGSTDFIGVNHYSTLYIKDCLHSPCESGGDAWNGFLYRTGVRDGVPIGEPMALVFSYVVPEGMNMVVTHIKNKYNNTPMFVTENGYSDAKKPGETKADYLNDSKRVNYLKTYLASLSTAIRNGADVRGYFIWSLLDNFEWSSGFTARFGIYHVDYDTQKRTPKMSAIWYRDFLTGRTSNHTGVSAAI